MKKKKIIERKRSKEEKLKSKKFNIHLINNNY